MRDKKEINIHIGNEIRIARERAGLTQEQFGEIVSLGTKNVSDIERGVAGITTAAIFTFINCWNEYTLACIFIRDNQKFPLTLMLQQFVEQYSTDWAAMAAAAAIGTIPTLCFLLLAQKYLVNGLTAGAVKG